MKANYWFKVYRKYADDYVQLSVSANTKKEAIAELRERMFKLDLAKPRIKDFKFLSKNTTIISLDKKYRTREGKRVVLHEISKGNESSPVKGNIILKESPLRKEFNIWTIHGEMDCVWSIEHKDDLIEIK